MNKNKRKNKRNKKIRLLLSLIGIILFLAIIPNKNKHEKVAGDNTSIDYLRKVEISHNVIHNKSGKVVYLEHSDIKGRKCLYKIGEEEMLLVPNNLRGATVKVIVGTPIGMMKIPEYEIKRER